MKKLSIVVPCYNESSGLSLFVDEIAKTISELSDYEIEVILVDDGSTDTTGEVLRLLFNDRKWIKIISLTRNFGKEAALTAGLDFASGDAVVFMDADLQHPPATIKEMLPHWERGHPVVAARRASRETDSLLYKLLAQAFYRLHNRISDIAIPENIGDFRLIDRRVADQLRSLRENRRFMKGLFAWLGYKPLYVQYTVGPRVRGSSSFNRWKSWNFALEGITSFSTVPLRIWSYIGASVLIFGVAYSIAIILKSLIWGVSTPGYVTLLTAVVVFGGVQLIGIGVLGEYIGRIYIEVKQRPPYLIEKVLTPGHEANAESKQDV